MDYSNTKDKIEMFSDDDFPEGEDLEMELSHEEN